MIDAHHNRAKTGAADTGLSGPCGDDEYGAQHAAGCRAPIVASGRNHPDVDPVTLSKAGWHRPRCNAEWQLIDAVTARCRYRGAGDELTGAERSGQDGADQRLVGAEIAIGVFLAAKTDGMGLNRL